MPKGVHNSNRAPHRTDDQRQSQRKEMLQLLRRGWTTQDIADKFGVHPSQISYDYRFVLQELRQQRHEFTWAEVTIKLEEYAEIKKEAWKGYQASKRPKEVVVDEDCFKEDGSGSSKHSVTTTKQVGDPRLLDIVIKCLVAERELLALDPPKTMKVQAQVINWDVLAGELPKGPVPDSIEAEIQKAMLAHDKALDTREEEGGIG